MRSLKVLSAVISIVASTSCTFNEPRLGVAPIVSAPGSQYYLPVGPFTANGIKYTCKEWHSPTGILPQAFVETLTGWHSDLSGCVYESADFDSVLTGIAPISAKPSEPAFPPLTDPENPRQIERKTRDLIGMSDYNCRHFLDAAFATKSDTAFSSSLISTILSATTTVITPISTIPALVPTAINAGNTSTTSAAAALDSNFFAKQSFDVMAEGIKAARAQRRAEIDARLCQTFYLWPKDKNRKKSDNACDIPKNGDYPGYHPAPFYEMSDALSDVISYDEICSIQGGLSQLSSAAAKKKREADQAAGLGGTDQKAPSSDNSNGTDGAADSGTSGGSGTAGIGAAAGVGTAGGGTEGSAADAGPAGDGAGGHAAGSGRTRGAGPSRGAGAGGHS